MWSTFDESPPNVRTMRSECIRETVGFQPYGQVLHCIVWCEQLSIELITESHMTKRMNETMVSYFNVALMNDDEKFAMQ